MLKIGITGQKGFVGTHLFNTLNLSPQKYTCIRFDDTFFTESGMLESFVKDCDVIFHLAAMNRHHDPEVLYQTNVRLVQQLIGAMEAVRVCPHIIFASSTQEEKDNLYGRSKVEGRRLLTHWAQCNEAKFTGLIIPNVYGPFGNPYYNSVVATFCHQISHDEVPVIEVDGTLNLIYVGELVNEMISRIEAESNKEWSMQSISTVRIPQTAEITVSGLLKLIQTFKDDYFKSGMLPDLDNSFKRHLFNTFCCYIDHERFYPFQLLKHSDNRGSFVEAIKLQSGGQVSFSTTVEGITRGNHFHTRKTERFIVVKGKARIDIRRVDSEKVISYNLDGENPSFVDMPIWYTHNITNTGKDELLTIFWINELYDPSDPDTYFTPV